MNKLKLAVVAVLAIVGLTALAYLPHDIIQEEQLERIATWKALGDYNPGAGAGGFLSIVAMELPDGSSINTALNTSFAVNLSYVEADAFNVNLPHSTKFGIYITARFNQTQAYSLGNTTWVSAWTRCNITGVNLSIGPIFMNKTEIANDATYMYMRFYTEMNSTGQPLMLARDQRLDLSTIQLEAYY